MKILYGAGVDYISERLGSVKSWGWGGRESEVQSSAQGRHLLPLAALDDTVGSPTNCRTCACLIRVTSKPCSDLCNAKARLNAMYSTTEQWQVYLSS